MHNPHEFKSQPSFLFRAVCAIVFSTLLIETVASANTTTDTDPFTTLLQTITSIITSATGSTSATMTTSTASDSTGTTSLDPNNNPPPPPPPPPTW